MAYPLYQFAPVKTIVNGVNVTFTLDSCEAICLAVLLVLCFHSSVNPASSGSSIQGHASSSSWHMVWLLVKPNCQARSYLLISGEPNDYNWVTKNKQSRVSRSHVHHQWLSQDKARFHIICQEVFTLPALLALELACLPPPDMFTLDWLCHHNLLMIVSDRLFSWFIYPCHLFLFFFVGIWLLFSVCIFGNDNALIKCYSICMAAHCFVTLPPALALQCCHRMPLPHGCDGLHLCQNTMLLSHATLLHTVL